MKTVLFLTYRMMLGFGVDVVVHQVSMRLRKRGYRIVVGCIEAAGTIVTSLDEAQAVLGGWRG